MREKPKGRPNRCKICKQFFRVENKSVWAKEKMPCPHCSSKYCCLPETERELRIMQDKFFENDRNEVYMAEMYKILNSYAGSLILKSNIDLKNQETIEYHSHNATTLLIEEYYKTRCRTCSKVITYEGDIIGQVCKCDIPKPKESEFKIELSFGGFLKRKIQQSIYGKDNHASADVSTDLEDEDGAQIFQLAAQDNAIKDLEDQEEFVATKENLANLIVEMDKACDSNLESLMRLNALLIYFKKQSSYQGEKAVNKFFSMYKRQGKLAFYKTMDLAKKEFQTLLM